MHAAATPDMVRARGFPGAVGMGDSVTAESEPVGMPGPAAAAPDAWRLIDALLYSVSHDLRSPLLSMTLSAELIEEGLRAGSGAGVTEALPGLRQGAADLERMLQALTLLSRARRREVVPAAAPLRLILGGYRVSSDVPQLDKVTVATDPLVVREFLDALGHGDALAVVASVEGEHVVLAVDVPEELQDATSPLEALAGSLQRFAGHPSAGASVEGLAAQQLLLERQGARVRIDGGRLLLALPRARAGGPR